MLSPVSFLADVTSTDEEEKLTRDASANEEWSKVIAINLDATFYYCKYAANTMLEGNGGKIINVASLHTLLM